MATGTLGQGVNMEVETRFTSLLVKCLKKFSIVEIYKRTFSVRTIMTKENERNFQMSINVIFVIYCMLKKVIE